MTILPQIDPKWSIGPATREVFYHIAKLNIHKEILEIGCFQGYSTSAFVAALNEGANFNLTLCDIQFTAAVLEMAKTHPNIITKQLKSEEVIDSNYDLIFVDGDHSLLNVARELMLLLRANTKTIIAHDITIFKNTSRYLPFDGDFYTNKGGGIGPTLLKQVYDNHREYYNKTLFAPDRSFLEQGTSFYSKDEEVIKEICKIIDRVLESH